tara:strand:- start:762 stop:1217 length:456 start_codon:yes stop_codon:yes gene_type:complete
MGTLFRKILILLPICLYSFELLSEVHTVKMLNQGSTGVMVFEPAVLKINVGDTVTFEATDAAHNSASIPGMLPPNANAWNGQLSRDISVTFDIPGIYGYQCTPHAMMAMVGVIQVGDDYSNLQNVKNSAVQFKTTFVMNQTRLDDYLSQLN